MISSAHRHLVLACAALPLLACGSTRTKSDAHSDARAKPPLAEDAPWTEQFTKPALLVADEIRIEGPVGLLAHAYTPHDPELHDRSEKTVPSGYLQEISVKPEVGPAEIRGKLDNLTIVALKRLVVLERPGPVDVVVLAAGDAYWNDQTTKEEQRSDTLRFVGKVRR